MNKWLTLIMFYSFLTSALNAQENVEKWLSGKEWVQQLKEDYRKGSYHAFLKEIEDNYNKGYFYDFLADVNVEDQDPELIAELTQRADHYQREYELLEKETKSRLVEAVKSHPDLVVARIVYSLLDEDELTEEEKEANKILAQLLFPKIYPSDTQKEISESLVSQIRDVTKEFQIKKQMSFQSSEGESRENNALILNFVECEKLLEVAKENPEVARLVRLSLSSVEKKISRRHDWNYLAEFSGGKKIPTNITEEKIAQVLADHAAKQMELIKKYFKMETHLD